MITDRTKECVYRDELAASLSGARTEVRCTHGLIDVLTDDEVIEVKRLGSWKEGIGQLLSYGLSYPERVKRLHILIPGRQFPSALDDVIRPACEASGIRITYQYEYEHAVTVYFIGDRKFRSYEAIETHIKWIRIQYRSKDQEMEPEHKQFILDLVNQAELITPWLGSDAVDARVKPDHWEGTQRLSVGHFQVRTEDGHWKAISARKHIEPAMFKAKREVVYITK